MTSRMYPHDQIKFNSVLSLDNDVTLNQEEINFAFSVWQSFPHRIVGFPSRVRAFIIRIKPTLINIKPKI